MSSNPEMILGLGVFLLEYFQVGGFENSLLSAFLAGDLVFLLYELSFIVGTSIPISTVFAMGNFQDMMWVGLGALVGFFLGNYSGNALIACGLSGIGAGFAYKKKVLSS